jgi:hypothetical protein
MTLALILAALAVLAYVGDVVTTQRGLARGANE